MKNIISCIALLITVGIQSQTFEWAKSCGSTSLDGGNSITVDALGNVYTTGFFEGIVDFDPGIGIFNLSSTAGSTDIFVQKLDASGNFIWAKSFGGPFDDRGNSITVNASGDVYNTGIFQGTVDFDPGTGIANLTSATGNPDIFVQKLDAFGNYIWAKSFGSASFDYVNSITVDASGYVYTTGFFVGTGDFNPGEGTTNLTSVGILDVFVQKLDASGNYIWARSFGGPSDDRGYSITVDTSGNIYTTGFFQGTGDFDPGLGTANLTSAGAQDIFIHKLDASGNFIWAKSFGSASLDYGNSITVDTSGNVYTVGYFRETVDFDPGFGTVNLSSSGISDIFVLKLDNSGNYIWAKSFGGVSNDFGISITLDASGNVYTTGNFEESVDFDPGAGITNFTSAGELDIFVQKLDASGNFIWAKSFGGAFDDIGNSIKVDAFGNIYTTGHFIDTVDFDPGVGIANLTSAGELDVFVQKISQLPLGIQDNIFDQEVKVFPNPVTESFSIELEN